MVDSILETFANFIEAHPYIVVGIVHLMMAMIFLCGWFDVLGVGR